jgi:hypothetical protein
MLLNTLFPISHACLPPTFSRSFFPFGHALHAYRFTLECDSISQQQKSYDVSASREAKRRTTSSSSLDSAAYHATMSSSPSFQTLPLPSELAMLSLGGSHSDAGESDEEIAPPLVLSSKQERIERAIELGRKTYVRSQAETPFGVSSSKGKVDAGCYCLTRKPAALLDLFRSGSLQRR